MDDYIATQNKQLKTEIICYCGKELNERDLGKLLTMAERDELERRRLLKTMNEFTVSCLTVNCNGCYERPRDGDNSLFCFVCNKHWCLTCKIEPYHFEYTCDEYQEILLSQ